MGRVPDSLQVVALLCPTRVRVRRRQWDIVWLVIVGVDDVDVVVGSVVVVVVKTN